MPAATTAFFRPPRALGSSLQPIGLASLAHAHLDLVHTVARQPEVRRACAACGLPPAAVLGAGTIGLYAALARFDAGRGTKLTTLATPHIRGAMLRATRGERLRVAGRRVEPVEWLEERIGAADEFNQDALRDRLAFVVGWYLTARQAEVIRRRFGLEDSVAETQVEVAEQLGITQGQVARIETTALSRLRMALEQEEVTGG